MHDTIVRLLPIYTIIAKIKNNGCTTINYETRIAHWDIIGKNIEKRTEIVHVRLNVTGYTICNRCKYYLKNYKSDSSINVPIIIY